MLAPSEYFACLLKTQATSTRLEHPTSKLSTEPLNACNDSGPSMDMDLVLNHGCLLCEVN